MIECIVLQNKAVVWHLTQVRMETVSFQHLRMPLVNMDIPFSHHIEVWSCRIPSKQFSQCRRISFRCFFNTTLGRLFTRNESSWNIWRSNYTPNCCRYARSWDICYFYSSFRRTNIDIFKIRNPTVSCYTWTFFWRRRNTLCCYEASVWYILFLRNIF